jgi:hypothetical protein
MNKLKKALKAAGIEYADFVRAIEFFQKRGIDFNFVSSYRNRGFRFWRWVSDGRPQMIILWTSPEQTREYLDAPSTIIAALDNMNAAIIGGQ